VHPEDFTRHALPVVMRGYDKERVDRLLGQVTGAYTSVWQQNQSLRERMRALELALAQSQDEARVSARSLAELMQSSAPPTSQTPPPTRKAVRELEARLSGSERDREAALEEGRVAWARVAELEEQLSRSEHDRQQSSDKLRGIVEAETEAARVLLAAARAAADVRGSSRARALRTLLTARRRVASLEARVAREQTLLAEVIARRGQAESQAEQAESQAELLITARDEAGLMTAAVAKELDRARELLSGALTALDAQVADGLVADLELRVQRAKEPSD
jgi:cell division septum initiation protein DivIVA